MDVVKLGVDHELGRNNIPQLLALILIKTKNICIFFSVQISSLFLLSIPKEHFDLIVFVVLRENLLDNGGVILWIHGFVDIPKSVRQK